MYTFVCIYDKETEFEGEWMGTREDGRNGGDINTEKNIINPREHKS